MLTNIGKVILNPDNYIRPMVPDPMMPRPDVLSKIPLPVTITILIVGVTLGIILIISNRGGGSDNDNRDDDQKRGE